MSGRIFLAVAIGVTVLLGIVAYKDDPPESSSPASTVSPMQFARCMGFADNDISLSGYMRELGTKSQRLGVDPETLQGLYIAQAESRHPGIFKRCTAQ